MKDGEGIRSPTTPGGVSKSLLNKTNPTFSRGCPSAENATTRPTVDHQRSFDEQSATASNDKLKQSRSTSEISMNSSMTEQAAKE